MKHLEISSSLESPSSVAAWGRCTEMLRISLLDWLQGLDQGGGEVSILGVLLPLFMEAREASAPLSPCWLLGLPPKSQPSMGRASSFSASRAVM